MASDTSGPQQVESALSPRVAGVTPKAGVKGQRGAAAPPATAVSPAGAAQQAIRSQITKGQRNNLAPPETAASPPGAWLNRPTTKHAG